MEIELMGIFDSIQSESSKDRDDSVYFYVEKGDYFAFLRQSQDTVQAGYTAGQGGLSRIAHLSLLEGQRTMMTYSANGTIAEQKLSQEDAANRQVTGFIDDLVRMFR